MGSQNWTGCYYCGASLGPGVRRCSKCGARICYECGSCFCTPDYTPRDYQRYFKFKLDRTLAIYEVRDGHGRGDLYALCKIEEDPNDGDCAIIRDQSGKEYRVKLEYLQQRCYRLAG